MNRDEQLQKAILELNTTIDEIQEPLKSRPRFLTFPDGYIGNTRLNGDYVHVVVQDPEELHELRSIIINWMEGKREARLSYLQTKKSLLEAEIRSILGQKE